MMETSTILSIILTASVSALSLTISILTIIFNNQHQRKMKILDIVYEKKFAFYNEFFRFYADFCKINKNYGEIIQFKRTDIDINEEKLLDIIMDCLTVSNDDTTKYLMILRKDIQYRIVKNKKKDYSNDLFIDCITSMKKELNLK